VRLAMLAVSVLGLLACTSQTQVPRPKPYITQAHPKAIVIERVDGSRVRVHEPDVVGDTIVGKSDQGADIRLPMKDVATVSLRHMDWGLTDALIGAGAAVVFFAVVQMRYNNDTSTTPHP
jgi:hypothetical protein